MATTMALPVGFNNLGRSFDLCFSLMDHFLYQFYTFSEKMKKIYRLEVEMFAKFTIKFHSFSSSFICAAVSKASWRVKSHEQQG